MSRFLTAVLLVTSSLPILASELDLTLGSDSLRVEFVTPVGQEKAGNVPTLDVGLLYREEDNSDGLLAHVGLLIFGDTGAPKGNIQAGLGGRAILFDADSDAGGSATGGALALGGTLRGRLPEFNRLGGSLWAYYAPKVSSFSDLDDFLEYGIGLNYQLIRQAFLIVGYREIRLKVDSARRSDLEDGAYAGLRLVF